MVTLELMRAISAAFNSRDVERIVDCFAEDATFCLARGPEPVGRSRRSCASRRTARSAATIACRGTGSPCRSRRSAIATITSRPPCECTNIPTAGSPSSMARAALPASMATESRSMPYGPPNSARPARPDGFVDNAARCPQPHRPINHRSGHMTCYERRTSSRATDSPVVRSPR